MGDETVNLTIRPDLRFSEIQCGDDRHWVVKDPIGATLFHLSQRDYCLLRLLDGHQDVECLVEQANRIVAPDQISKQSLQRFYDDAASKHLLTDCVEKSNGDQHSNASSTSTDIISPVFRLLAYRFPGLPSGILIQRLASPMRGISASTWFGAFTLLWLIGAAIVLVNIGLIGEQFMFAATRSGMSWWISLLAVIAAAKIVHELAHGIACELCGGRCREIGVMLLVGTPCLFCDVSDAWLLPERWKRMLISAAGMIAEISLASVAAIGWMISQPGMFHDLCLMTMVVCSISTVLFNGNPLLRYDGYFILSDALNAPNLSARSARTVVSTIRKLVWGGLENQNVGSVSPSVGKPISKLTLLTYGVLSGTYRFFMIAAISMLLYHWTDVISFRYLGVVLGTVLFFSMVHRFGKFVLRAPNSADVARSRRRRRLVLAMSTAVLIAILLVPIRRTVVTPAILMAAETSDVVLRTSGQLIETIEDGKMVEQGQTIMRIRNDRVESGFLAAKGNLAAARKRLEVLQKQKALVRVSEQIEIQEKEVESAERQVRRLNKLHREMIVTARSSGRFFASHLAHETDPGDAYFSSPSHSTACRRNLSRFFPEGSVIGQIGATNRWEIICFLSEFDIGRIQVGQIASFNATGSRQKRLSGVVTKIASAPTPIENIPPELSAAWQNLTSAGSPPINSENNSVTLYEVHVQVNGGNDIWMPHRSVSSGSIRTDSQCLLSRAVESVRSVF